MAEEEVPPPEPNVVGSFSVGVVAPVGLVYQLLADVAEMPRLYDSQVTYTKSCGRDRETRACTSKQMYLNKPKVVLEHTVALSPVGPKEIPAEVPAPAEGEEPAEPAEPLPPTKVIMGEVSLPVSSAGPSAAEMSEVGLGGLTFSASTPDDGSDSAASTCTLTISASMYMEAPVEADFTTWAAGLGATLKDLSEKVAYLAPTVSETSQLRAVVAKAKTFNFIPTALAVSPSAVARLGSGAAGGSLGYFKDKPAAAPISMGLSTRPLGTVRSVQAALA